MAGRIEDYAIIGDTQTAALVCADGSIDWLCLPRFDSGALFAALLGDDENGRWSIAPRGPVENTTRRYVGDSLVLETTFETASGTVKITDCMPIRSREPDVVRLVEGVDGTVEMHMDLRVRFDYGRTVPWVMKVDDGLRMVAGPDAVTLQSPVTCHGEDKRTVADFTVEAGQKVPFLLAWHPSYEDHPTAVDVEAAIAETIVHWEQFAEQCSYDGPQPELVKRSLITLKALTYEPTGGIVAAATTSLPEHPGGSRNWDYRYCWLRDSTLTMQALLLAGYRDEAEAWERWLLRAVAGSPEQMQIIYGPAGERHLPEIELDWLAGYENSRPVRIGNAAANQFQLDVYGEIMDTFHMARLMGIQPAGHAWDVQKAMLEYLEGAWSEPDEGIWEVRGPRRHFTHSKVMAWVAFDRAVKAVDQFGLDGPADRWRAIRDQIHAEVCEHGFDAKRDTFTQYYGSDELDAAVLMIPLVHFLPADDDRVHGTVAAIQRDLVHDGFVRRYSTSAVGQVDGIGCAEATFLPCTFWLVEVLVLLGRQDEAEALFDQACAVGNDVGLFAEEYDPEAKRMLGNFPQAFTHLALVGAGFNIAQRGEPARRRGDGNDG
ncbi:MAG: glycoside hydrolase family 15 protein [Acidimicrobiales bacterium]